MHIGLIWLTIGASDRHAFVSTVINLYFCEMREFLERLSNR